MPKLTPELVRYREIEAYQGRLNGETYTKLAKRLGVTRQGVAQMAKRGEAKYKATAYAKHEATIDKHVRLLSRIAANALWEYSEAWAGPASGALVLDCLRDIRVIMGIEERQPYQRPVKVKVRSAELDNVNGTHCKEPVLREALRWIRQIEQRIYGVIGERGPHGGDPIRFGLKLKDEQYLDTFIENHRPDESAKD